MRINQIKKLHELGKTVAFLVDSRARVRICECGRELGVQR